MQMTGEQRIPASRERVWDALNDPDVLRVCIPGCQALARESDDRLAATVEIKIGPIGARFKGAVQLTDIDAPNGYTISGTGNGGIAGTAKGGAKVRLSDDGDGATLLVYTVDAEVGGRMAQLGGPIIDATARQLAGKFFAAFAGVVGEASATPAVDARAARAAPEAGDRPASNGRALPAPSQPAPSFWLLIAAIAGIVGFLLGHAGVPAGSDWSALAIALLIVLIAGAAFEHGRRAGATTLVLDDAILRRLLAGSGG